MSVSLTSAQSQTAAKLVKLYEEAITSRTALYSFFYKYALSIAVPCLVLSFFPIYHWRDAAALMGLVVAMTLLTVRLPNSTVTTYPGIPILFAIVGLLGASAGVLAAVACVIVDGLVSLPATHRFRVKLYLPNIAVQTISIGGCGLMYTVLQFLFFPTRGVRIGETIDWRCCIFLPLCSFAAFVVNALLTTTAVSVQSRKRWDIVWHNDFKWQMNGAVLMAPLCVITAALYNEHWWLGIGFIIVPVFAMRTGILTHERRMAAYRQGVELLGRIMQEAHPYTHGHLHRVARWARKIAEEMNLPPASMQYIEDAAILHDIGKVAVDDRVLNKVGKLTDDDWSMIKRHPVTGAELIIKMSVMGQVSHWIRHHHERPDGKGYPDGLAESDIPIESAIISAVDAFDAMVGGPAKEDQRPYRQPMSQEAAIGELKKHAGTQFHSDVVEVFVTILDRERQLEANGEYVGSQPGLADDALWSGPMVSASLSHSS